MWCLRIEKLIPFRCLKAPTMAHGYAQAAYRNFVCLWPAKGLSQEKVEAPSGFGQQYLNSLKQRRRNATMITLYERLRSVRKQPLWGSASPTSGRIPRRSRVFSASRSFRRFT